MDLLTLQRALAQLYTDPALEGLLERDAAAAAVQLGMDVASLRSLQESSGEQIRLFSRSLVTKRAGEVRKQLPLTSSILGVEFDVLFRKYAVCADPVGGQKRQLDVLCFARALIRSQSTEEPRWLPDVIRFEAARIRSVRLGRPLVLCLLHHAIFTLYRTPGSPPARGPVLVIWLRAGGALRELHFPLSRAPR